MITIGYQKLGQSLSDCQVEGWCETIIHDINDPCCPNKLYRFSTENIFHRLRAKISLGLIPHDKILFMFLDDDHNTHLIKPDKYGRLDFWPEGFCDFNERSLQMLFCVGDAWNKPKSKKEKRQKKSEKIKTVPLKEELL